MPKLFNEDKNINYLYQYSNGEYLPDSSQPNECSYEITSAEYTPHKSTRYIKVIIGDNGFAQIKSPSGEYEDIEKLLPELYSKREDCCGCTACYSVCSNNAIEMLPDEEGFLYPVVNASLCIRCYLCVKVCPIK